MKDYTKEKIDHPKFQYITSQFSDRSLVACFLSSSWVELPPEVVEAHEKIKRAVQSLEKERKLVGGDFHGNLVYYHPHRYSDYKQFTEEEQQQLIELCKRTFPELNIETGWVYQNNSQVGFSVQMVIPPELRKSAGRQA